MLDFTCNRDDELFKTGILNKCNSFIFLNIYSLYVVMIRNDRLK